ncbi:HupE/UreJ family protein [Synechococcus sp. HK01-R]|jgi:urease accessory protein|uniref:HupE/UreJ family protein n=1 Tax=Synechococcus sp. HK01-R TaxID=2751171 RepID=UPI0016233618|nr:HupE/UreJ family protein [Synechococcus sp. HK01-R]QNG26846.1 HupE/UreJ family protein [Synechococcus sp. HK01-R]
MVLLNKRRLLLPVGLTAALVSLVASPSAQAHGEASGGLIAGVAHPLLGLDHLVMLVAVGTVAAALSTRLVLWALVGALLGAVVGFGGLAVPAAEILASLAIAAVGLVLLAPARLADVAGPLVSGGIAIHAMLHGLEAPRDQGSLLWWAGALLASALVVGVTTVLMQRVPAPLLRRAGAMFVVLGGGLLLLPVVISA